MYSLFMTILCSSSIALILKFNDSKKGSPIILLSGNYFLASIVSMLLIFTDNSINVESATIGFGIIMGLFFVVSFFSFAKAVSVAGTPLATISSRLSVIVPVILSLIFFSEIPNKLQIIGLITALITIYIFYKSLKNKSEKIGLGKSFYLLAVLIGIGISDFGMKIFQNFNPATEKNLFLLSIFLSAFIYTIIYIRLSKTKFNKTTFLQGMVLGIPNLFSSYFLINALSEMKAIVVYPTVNLGIILLTTLLAKIIWNEKLNNLGKVALLLGSVAIVLLSL